jgi:hypothetical protein
MFAGLMLLAAACKKEAEITNTADLGKPVFFFTGQAGSDGVSLAAGQNNITVTPTNVQEEALVPGTSTPDANLFKTGSWFGDIYGNNLPWFVSVLFAVPSADSLKVKTYPVAVGDVIVPANSLYSAGKVAVKLRGRTMANHYSSYAYLNSNTAGQFVEITAIENYSDNGTVRKKVSFRLNVKVYRMDRVTFYSDVKTLTGEGVAVF